MEPCRECGFDWESTSGALIGVLRSARPAFAEAVAGRATETARRRPAPGTWSVIEYVGHTADGVGWYDERITTVLEHDRPRLTPFDWDAFTEERRYDLRPMRELLDDVDERCRSLATRLQALDDDQWRRTGIGSDGGDRTVLALARRAVHEVHHHLYDVRRQ
ncbi:MAG: DinB family protein [Acidimicrobiales bacterium]|nr:DinB family protein [Acidimicrobiales bacterium]